MRAIIKHEPAPGLDFTMDAATLTSPAPGHVKVAVAAASVCGTDVGILNYSPAAQGFNLRMPVTIGHEGSGTVVEVGEGVTKVAVGDRVAFESHISCGECFQCRTGSAHLCEQTLLLGLHVDGVFAETCVVPAQAVYRLPADFDLEAAALLEPAGVALHAIQTVEEPLLGKRVLVVGAGPVGAMIADLAHVAGAAHVALIEPNAWRREFAAGDNGFTTLEPGVEVVDTLRGLSADRGGFDVAFEASGHPSGFTTSIDALRVGGTYVAVGFGGHAVSLDAGEYLNRRGIVFRGSFGRRLWSTWDVLVTLITEGRFDISRYVTHRFGLSEVDEAFESLKGDAMKILFIPERA